MKSPKFIVKDVAASREIWWELVHDFYENYRRKYRKLIQNGLRSFLGTYLDNSKCTGPRDEVIQILLHIGLMYSWAKKSFDGGDAYKKTDALIKRLERVGKLAEQLAIASEDIEKLYFVGDVALNQERLSGLRDSQGSEHQGMDTFVGELMTRICIDSTVMAEGLEGIGERTMRRGGRPPVVSKTYLILTGMDLYENVFQLGRVSITSPINPTGPDDYSGGFFDFISCYTAVLASDDFAISKQSTGFGSVVAKISTQYRKDPDLLKSLNPTSDTSSLILSLNRLAAISSSGTRVK